MTAVPTVPAGATWSFVLLVAGVAAIFVWTVAVRARPAGEAPGASLLWGSGALAAAAVWLGAWAAIASTGSLLHFDARPPALLVMMPFFAAATTALAFSPLGTRLAAGIGFNDLIGFQSFRLVLEILLYQLSKVGAIPVQMTFAGYNFDIATGVLAVVLGAWARRRDPPRGAILGFNFLGIALLLHVVAIAILSLPTPFRHYHNDPPLTIVATVPFVWLPAFLVQAAWFAHLLVFRRLMLRRAEPQ